MMASVNFLGVWVSRLYLGRAYQTMVNFAMPLEWCNPASLALWADSLVKY